MEELTERQQEVLTLITRQVEQGRPFPSLREIAAHLGVRHKSGISGHIKALERKGYIERQEQRISDFKLIAANLPQTAELFPLVATIPAGTPRCSYDQNDEHVQFNRTYFGGGDLTAVLIQGDSMAGDSICDGDIAIIKLQREANPHDIVAVRIDHDEVTLKRLCLRHTDTTTPMVDLLPSNPAYPVRSLKARQVEIVGKLVGIVRKT